MRCTGFWEIHSTAEQLNVNLGKSCGTTVPDESIRSTAFSRINVNVRELRGEGDHFGMPRIADVTTDDLEGQEVESDALDVKRHAGFRSTERSGQTHLKADRHIQFNAGGLKRLAISVEYVCQQYGFYYHFAAVPVGRMKLNTWKSGS